MHGCRALSPALPSRHPEETTWGLPPGLPKAEAPGACPVCEDFMRLRPLLHSPTCFSPTHYLPYFLSGCQLCIILFCLQRRPLPPLCLSLYYQSNKKKKNHWVPRSGDNFYSSSFLGGGWVDFSISKELFLLIRPLWQPILHTK